MSAFSWTVFQDSSSIPGTNPSCINLSATALARTWFVRSVGSVTNEVVRNYVAGQLDHHRALPAKDPNTPVLAGYHTQGDPAELRAAAHAMFEYNVHLVLPTRRRVEFLDAEVSAQLVRYLRRVCEKHEWLPWDIEAVLDHVHLFLGLRPADSPQEVALSLMNNSAYFLRRRYPGALRNMKLADVWQPGYYVGTVGAATTAQVKAFLAAPPGGR